MAKPIVRIPSTGRPVRIAAAAAAAAVVLLAVLFRAPCRAEADGTWRALSHRIFVTVDIAARTMTGTDAITLEPPPGAGEKTPLSLHLRKGSVVDRVEAGGVELAPVVEEGEDERSRKITLSVPHRAGNITVTIHFHGTFPSIDSAREKIRRGVAYLDDGVMGPEGVLLLSSSLWYPTMDDEGLGLFDLTVTMDAAYTTVAEGELHSETVSGVLRTSRWRTDAPVDGLDLVAGRYWVEKERHGKVDMYTYFFEKDPELSRTYIDKTKAYLDLHSAAYGAYPYGKFAVVENFLPTGYGMPGFTLLGSKVLRLPFIPDTSLGHEILHNWWGNSVFMDPEGGNWVEALTTYGADYRSARAEGPDRALAFRVRNLRGYRNYAGGREDITLRGFTDATTPRSRAVGYNKGFFFFNMLERLIGPQAFEEALRGLYRDRAFKRASWDDLRKDFEEAAGVNLGWFFEQWLGRTGGPELALAEVRASETPEGWSVSFGISQRGEPYRLMLPVLVKTEGGELRRDVIASGLYSSFTLPLDSRPISLSVDPGREVFRLLSDSEMPPTLGGCFSDPEGVVVLPNRGRFNRKYFKVGDLIKTDFGLGMTTDAEPGRRDYLGGMTLFILGWPDENILASMMREAAAPGVKVGRTGFTVGGARYGRKDNVAALAFKSPHDPSKTVCLFIGGDDGDRVFDAGRRIKYFSQYSYVVFGPDGRAVRGIFASPSPLTYTFGPKAGGGAEQRD
ncbi:MAG: M1 family metallopeptidase [Thermodesulfobacteriota bacterium]